MRETCKSNQLEQKTATQSALQLEFDLDLFSQEQPVTFSSGLMHMMQYAKKSDGWLLVKSASTCTQPPGWLQSQLSEEFHIGLLCSLLQHPLLLLNQFLLQLPMCL